MGDYQCQEKNHPWSFGGLKSCPQALKGVSLDKLTKSIYKLGVRFVWDERKRRINLARHGLDFRDAAEMFQGPMLTAQDLREDYGEDRFQGVGFIQNRLAVIIYTEPEEDVIRVISLRKATKNEQERIAPDLANRLGPR